VTLSAMKYHYYWKGMSKDIKVFVGSCFHCIASAPGETTPRPMGEPFAKDETSVEIMGRILCCNFLRKSRL
jgi:Integrase zinc binding domain